MPNNIEQKDSLLPPPEIISRYKELGIGNDIIELVKSEQEHRHILQNKYQNNYRMGQVFGFLLCALVIANVFNLIKMGLMLEAYIMLGSFSVLTIMICFLTRTKGIVRRNINISRRPNNRKRNFGNRR